MSCPRSQETSQPPLEPTSLMGRPIVAKPVDQCATLAEVFESSMAAFGGALVAKAYRILRMALSRKIRLVGTIAGPITISDQHRAYLIPMIERGWFSSLFVTDAICYHDGHDCLEIFSERPIRAVDLHGSEKAYLDAGVIRVTDTGFPDQILYSQDAMILDIHRLPEFRGQMTTTQRNYLLGKYYAAQEEKVGARPGLLSTCYRHGIPVFVGAPADGSTFLNIMKLRLTDPDVDHCFGYDLAHDVLENCAYHYWGLTQSEAKALGILVLGGGVPKNYALQGEPALSQILGLPDIRGFDYGVQLTTAPETEGSLTSAKLQEGVSWGKINPRLYVEQTVNVPIDYSMIMPFIAKALLDDPELPKMEQVRLFDQRSELIAALTKRILA